MPAPTHTAVVVSPMASELQLLPPIRTQPRSPPVDEPPAALWERIRALAHEESHLHPLVTGVDGPAVLARACHLLQVHGLSVLWRSSSAAPAGIQEAWFGGGRVKPTVVLRLTVREREGTVEVFVACDDRGAVQGLLGKLQWWAVSIARRYASAVGPSRPAAAQRPVPTVTARAAMPRPMSAS